MITAVSFIEPSHLFKPPRILHRTLLHLFSLLRLAILLSNSSSTNLFYPIRILSRSYRRDAERSLKYVGGSSGDGGGNVHPGWHFIGALALSQLAAYKLLQPLTKLF
jgi:hypothetical protein